MPLARIFAHHPERTAALASQLQQQGYTVEVVSPDQAHLSPADLEIEFEICERADVLERAAGLADELHADIAVAPGVIQSTEPAQKPVPVQSSAVSQAPNPPTDREREFEAAFANTSVEEQNPAVIEIPVMARAPLPPVAFADDPAPAAPMHPEIVKPADPVPYLAQLTPFGTPQVDAETQNAALRMEKSTEREAARQEMAEAPAAASGATIWQRGADLTARAMANAKAIAASTVESFREHSQEYQKKAQIRSAETRAAHEARLLDLEQRRAEAHQRASELEAARQAAAARLIELVRQRDPGLHEEKSQEQNVFEERVLGNEPAASPRAAARPRPSGSDTWWHAAMAVVAKKRPPMSPQLRAVMTGAVAITLLFVVGIILGSLYPRTPLAKPSNQTSNGAQSGGVTVQGGGVTVKAGGPSKPTPGSKAPQAPATTAAASQPQTAQDKPSPKVDQTKRIAAQQGEEDLGDDVVIRHFQRPVPTQRPKQSGQQAGLKHFSDLDTQ